MLPKPPAASCDWVCCDWPGFAAADCDACLGCLGGGGWQDDNMDSLPAHDLIWTGSYTADSGGRGTGIGIAEGVALNGSRLDRTSGRHPVPACRAIVRGG